MSNADAKEVGAADLIRQTGATDVWNESWRQLYDQFGVAIVAYARRRGLQEAAALDVLQEVMATILRSQHGLAKGYDAKEGIFKAWLWGIIRNRTLEAIRRCKKSQTQQSFLNHDDEEHIDYGKQGVCHPPDPIATEEQKWQEAILDAAMERVRQRVGADKFAIFIKLLEQKISPDQIAEETGNTRNNIDAIKHRCKNMAIEEAKKIRDEWECLRQTQTRI